MIILGLGSNIGDRLENLRRAYHHINAIPEISIQQVSPIYISDALLPDNADDSWNNPFLNLAIRCETTLTPYELLLKTKWIEKQLGRHSAIDWSPRIIDIDILAWDNLVKYDDKLHVPHEHLHERPFALWPLSDVAPFWTYPIPGPLYGKTAIEIAEPWGPKWGTSAPLHTKQIPHRIDTPVLMGVVNITPDSFSDGGNYFHPDLAMKKIIELVDAGAEIIDLGAESTGPKSIPLHASQEWQRLEPVLTTLLNTVSSMSIPPKISVDTRHVETAEKALTLGVDWINDVTGLDNPEMYHLLREKNCNIVFMHHLGVPVNQSNIIPVHKNPVEWVYQWAEKKLAELAISPERLIFDLGIGYGKTAEQSLFLLNNMDVFKKLGVKLLIGHSRKSFLSAFTPFPAMERDIETLCVSLQMKKMGVNYLRVHNVEAHARAFKTINAFLSKQLF